jgi:hypothetical protein
MSFGATRAAFITIFVACLSSKFRDPSQGDRPETARGRPGQQKMSPWQEQRNSCVAFKKMTPWWATPLLRACLSRALYVFFPLA